MNFYCDSCGAPDQNAHDLLEQLKQAETELTALREATRWIPCSEKMPRIGSSETQYLVAVDAQHIKMSWYSIDIGWDYRNVTHWKPLPAPPTKEGA